MSYQRKARRWLAVSSAAAAAVVSLGAPAIGGNAPSQYTGGGSGTAQQPASGNFSTGFVPPLPAGGAATLELDFSNGGTNSFTATDDLTGALNLNEIQLNSTSSGLGTIAANPGSSLNLVYNGAANPTILQDNTGQWTLGAPISIGASAFPLVFGGEFVNGAAAPVVTGNVFVTAPISGTGGQVVFSGVDNTFLQAANTYTGTTTLNSGTLTLDFSAATAPTNGNILYNGVTPAAFVMAGGNLVVNGNAGTAETQTVGGLTLGGGGGTIVVNSNGQSTTLALGAITRTIGGSVDFSGTGTVTTTTLNKAFTNGTNPASILGGWATFGGGSTWAVTSNTAGTNAVTGLATYSPTFTAATDVDAPIGTSAPGAMTINSLRFNNAGAYAVNAGGAITIASGGILETAGVGPNAVVLGAAATTNTLTSGNAADLVVNQFNPAGTMTINSILSGAIGLTKAGPGTLIIGSQVNTFTGDVYVNGGTLQVAGGTGANGTATAGPLGIFTGGTSFKRVFLNNNATFAIAGSYNVNVPSSTLPGNGQVFIIGPGGGQFSVASGATFTIDDGSGGGVATSNAELQGTGDLTKLGAGTLSLGNGSSNFSAFTGQIFIDAGTVQFGNGGTFQLGSTSAGTFINATAVMNLNGQNIGAEPLTLNGTTASGGLVNNTGTGTATGPINLAGANNYVGGSATLSLGGVIRGGSLTQVGNGTLVLGNANTYTGGTTVSAGTLKLTNGTNGSATGTGPVALADGATLASAANGAGTAAGAVSGPASGMAVIAPGGVYPAGGAVNSTIGTLNLGSLNATANTSLTFDLNNPNAAGSTYDTINILNTDGLTVTGTVPIVLGQLPALGGIYRLISFNASGTLGFASNNFSVQATSGNGRVTYAVSVDSAGGNQYLVDLTATGNNAPITTVFNNPNPSLDGAGNADWTQSVNWSNGVPGVAGDVATLNNGATDALTIDLNGQQHVGSLTFANGGTGSYTLAAGTGGSGLYMDTGSTSPATLANSTNNNTISAPVVLQSPTNVFTAGGTTFTINGVISGGSSLTSTASSAGVLQLGAANTYTGGTNINGGTVQLGAVGGVSTAGPVVINAGGTLDINNFAVTNPMTINGTGVGGNGAIVNSSAAGANPTMSGAITLGSDSTIGVPNNFVITGVVSGAHALTVIGPGQLSLNASNTFSGGLVIGNGTGIVTPGTSGAAPTPPAVATPNGFIATTTGDLGFGAAGAPVTMTNGSQAFDNVTAQVTDTHSFFIGGTVAMGIGQNQKWLFQPNNAFTGPGTATIIRYAQTGAVLTTTTNDFQLAGNNSGYAGAWILEGGATEAQTPTALGNNAPTNTVMLYSTSNGGADEIASNNLPQAITSAGPADLSSVIGGDNNVATATYSGPITLDYATYVRMGPYFAATSQNIAFTNTLSGPGAIAFLPPNNGTLNGQQLILSGNNVGYGAAFNIPAGVALVAASPNALGSSSATSGDLANTVTLANGAALDIQTALAATEVIAPVSGTGINGTGVIRNTGGAGAGGSFAGSIPLGGNATFGVTGAGGLTLSGTISDGGAGYTLSSVGTNTSAPLILSNGLNSFGSFVVQSGTTQVNAAGALGSGNVTVGNTTGALNATLQLGGGGGITLANNITVGAGSTGVMTLRGVNPAGTTATYAGTITSGQSVTVDSTNAGATTAFSAGIGGSAAIVKGTGAGTVQLQGPNSYTGATTVNGGTLQFQVGNSGTGAITVNRGATLAGSGGANVALGGNLTLNLGGTLAPGGIGNTTGGTSLSLGGNLVLNNGSTIAFDFASGGAGPALENIVFSSASGTFTINGDPSLLLTNAPTTPGAYTLFNMTQDSSNLPGNGTLAQIAITPPQSGLTYVLQQGTGNDAGDIDLIVSGGSAASAVFMPNGANPVGGNAYSFNIGGNWNTAAVPNGSGSSATFPNVTAGTTSPTNTATITLDAPQHVGTLTLNPGAGFVYAFTAGSGGSLAIDTSLANSSGANTLAAPVSFTAPATVFVDTSGDAASSLTITSAGSLASGNAITKTGNGLFNIAGPATLTGGATVSGGTLQFSNTATGTSANTLSGTFAVGSGATLRGSQVASNVAGSLSNGLSGATISLSNGGVLALNPQDTTTAAGLFVRQLGAGTTGVNTTAENYTVNAAATSLVTATSTASSQTNLFASATANTGYDLSGKVFVPSTGTYTFGLNADDGARLFIDGQIAVNNDVGGGKAQTNTNNATTVQQLGLGIPLAAGFHEFHLEYTNTGGSGAVEVTFAGPGNINTGATTAVAAQTAMTFGGLLQPVAQSAAYNALPDAIAMSNGVSLASGVAATIDVGSTNTAAQRFVGVDLVPSSGAGLTLGSGASLTVTGSGTTLNPTTNLDAGQFLATTSTSLLGGGTVTITNAPDVYLGGLTDNGSAVNLVKAGTGQLVLDNTIGSANALTSGSTITVQQGRLHLYGPTNPLGSATLALAGAGTNTPDVVLDTHSGAYTLDTPITVSSNAKIEDWNDTVTTTLGGNNGIALAGGKTLTFDAIGGSSNGTAAGATLALAGVVSGAGGIAVQSTDYGSTTTLPGVVLFQNPSNSFAGGLTVNSGTATASAGTALNSTVLGTGPITLLTPTAGTPSLLNLLANGPGSSTGSTLYTLTYGNGTSPDPLTVSGTGSTTINVANNGGNTGNIEALGTLTIGSATLNVTGGNGYSLSFPAVTLTGTPTLAPSSVASLFLGPITGTGSQGVTLAGSGNAVAVFNGAANYPGPFSILSGNARLGVASAVNPASSLLAYGGTLDLNGVSPTTGSFTTVAGPGTTITNNGAAPSTLTIAGGNNTFSGTLADGSSKLAVVLSGGTTQLAGFNTFSGGLTVNPGATLVSNNVSNALGINPFGAGPLNLNGGTLSLSGQVPLVGGLAAQFKQDTANPNQANYTSLLNLNSYFAGQTGLVTANTTQGGKTDFNFSNSNYAGPNAMFGTSPATATTANYGFTGTQQYDARFSGYITIPTAGTYTFATTSDDGSMVFVGSQNTPVVNNNAFQGATTKTGTYAFPAAGIYPITIAYFQGTGGEGLLVQMTPPGGTPTTLLQSQVESPGSTFTASQAYASPLNVTADSTVGVSNSLAASVGPLTIGSSILSLISNDASGATYGLTTGAVTLAGSPTFNVSNSTGNGAGTLTLPGITGGPTNGITKTGAATLAITGPGTYGGGTNVRGGTLLVSNGTGSATGTGPVVLGDPTNANAFSGILGGSGTVGGPVNVYNGSTIAPGKNATLTPGVTSAVATLTSGPQTWYGGGAYAWKLANAATPGGTAGTPGTDWDLLSMSTLTLDSTTANNGTPFQIVAQPLNGAVNNFNAGNGYSWAVARAADGSFTNLNAGVLAHNFVLNTNSLNNALGTTPANYSLAAAPDPSGSGSDLMIVYSPAPEPTSLLTLGVAAGGLLLRRRRRNNG